MTQNQRNDYDDTKDFLNKIRKITKNTAQDIREQLENPRKILDKGADVSSFGDPTQWQKDERQDRSISQPKEDVSNDETSGWDPSDKDDETQSMTNSIQKYWEDDPQPESTEKTDFNVINNVEVVINSTDKMDLEMKDDEKGKISQLIDDFRTEVSDIVKFGKLNIYDNNAKLDGNINDINLNFTLSAGDDGGLFLSNLSMLKVSDNVSEILEKLKRFQVKFDDTMGQIISNRIQN